MGWYTRLYEGFWEMVQLKDLDASERLVLIALMSFCDNNGKGAWPSTATLARRTGYSRRWIVKVVASLEKHGLIVKEERTGQTNMYTVTENLFEDWEKEGCEQSAEGGMHSVQTPYELSSPDHTQLTTPNDLLKKQPRPEKTTHDWKQEETQLLLRYAEESLTVRAAMDDLGTAKNKTGKLTPSYRCNLLKKLQEYSAPAALHACREFRKMQARGRNIKNPNYLFAIAKNEDERITQQATPMAGMPEDERDLWKKTATH